MEGRRRNSSIHRTDVRLGTHSLIRVFNHGHILKELDRLLANYLPHHSLPEQSTYQLSSLKTSSFHHSTCCQFPTVSQMFLLFNLRIISIYKSAGMAQWLRRLALHEIWRALQIVCSKLTADTILLTHQ